MQTNEWRCDPATWRPSRILAPPTAAIRRNISCSGWTDSTTVGCLGETCRTISSKTSTGGWNTRRWRRRSILRRTLRAGGVRAREPRVCEDEEKHIKSLHSVLAISSPPPPPMYERTGHVNTTSVKRLFSASLTRRANERFEWTSLTLGNSKTKAKNRPRLVKWGDDATPSWEPAENAKGIN